MTHIRGGNQDPQELSQFLSFIKDSNIRSYLEIGSRNGDSFWAVMTAIGAQARWGVAIDLPENGGALELLQKTRDDLEQQDICAELIIGDSRDTEAIHRVSVLDYDLLLIDADHTFDGVCHDYVNYAHLAKYVAFHDIAAPPGYQSDGKPNDVGIFWSALKQGRKTLEIITPGSNMGYGILLPEGEE